MHPSFVGSTPRHPGDDHVSYASSSRKTTFSIRRLARIGWLSLSTICGVGGMSIRWRRWKQSSPCTCASTLPDENPPPSAQTVRKPCSVRSGNTPGTTATPRLLTLAQASRATKKPAGTPTLKTSCSHASTTKQIQDYRTPWTWPT